MITLLIVIQLILAIIITIAVLLQKSSSIGLGAYSGSNESLFGAKGPAGFLTKFTFTVAIIFVLNTILLGYQYSKNLDKSIVDGIKDRDFPQTQENTIPLPPVPLAPNSNYPAILPNSDESIKEVLEEIEINENLSDPETQINENIQDLSPNSVEEIGIPVALEEIYEESQTTQQPNNEQTQESVLIQEATQDNQEIQETQVITSEESNQLTTQESQSTTMSSEDTAEPTQTVKDGKDSQINFLENLGIQTNQPSQVSSEVFEANQTFTNPNETVDESKSNNLIQENSQEVLAPSNLEENTPSKTQSDEELPTSFDEAKQTAEMILNSSDEKSTDINQAAQIEKNNEVSKEIAAQSDNNSSESLEEMIEEIQNLEFSSYLSN